MSKENELLALLRGDVSPSGQAGKAGGGGSSRKPPAQFKCATIDAAYANGRPKVTFDGESGLSTKAYPYLSSYAPTANDRVLMGRVAHGWVILGRIV